MAVLIFGLRRLRRLRPKGILHPRQSKLRLRELGFAESDGAVAPNEFFVVFTTWFYYTLSLDSIVLYRLLLS